MENKIKRFLSLAVAVIMVIGMLPGNVFASETAADSYVAKIGDETYATLTEAITAVSGMSGDVTIDIYGKAVVNGIGLNNANLTGLNFKGATTDAEICIDGLAYVDVRYTSYPVTYTDLILSHINGGYGNDGRLQEYFSTYNGGNVTYTNCSFPNGVTAMGSANGTTVTFNNCTFNNTTTKQYSLWVDGNGTKVIVNGGTFCGVRGVKLFAENGAAFSTLSVSGATFSDTITEKAAVVLTRGESVALTGNTYNNTTDTVQVDADYASEIEGKSVVIEDKEYTVDSASTSLVEKAEEAPVEVATEAELVAALANGGSIKLTADITTTAAITTSGVTATIDLNGKTLNVRAGDNKFNDATNLTIQNGTINIDGVVVSGNAIFRLDEYEETLVTTVTLNNVNLTGKDYSSAYGIFYIGDSSVLNVNGGEWTLTNDLFSAGGVFKADDAKATLNIADAKMTLHNVRRVVTYANTTIDGSTIAITGDADGVDAEMEHGFNRSPLTVTDSTITMENLVGRGITAEKGAVSISENSTVTITNAQEATIDVRGGQTVTVDSTSTVTVDAEPTITSGTVTGVTVNVPPKGSDFNGYTDSDRIWGQAWSNATESYVVKVLDANGNVMGTTALNTNLDVSMDGDVEVTWHICLDPSTDTDRYWIQEWTTAPTIDNQPAKVELWVDGVKVSGGNVVLNGPDDLNKIYAIVADADGKILSYHTTLAKAVAAAETGATILLKNGEYELPAFSGKELTFKGESKDGVIVNDAPNANAQGWVGSSIHFENLTAKGATANYHGLANGVVAVTYKNCNVNGLRFLYATNVSFEDCAFNANGVEHSFWTYGASNITVKNCTFTYTDRAVNCYSENGANHETDIAFTGCTFTYAGTAESPEGAVEINSGSSKSIDLTMDNCTAPEKGAMWFNSQWDSTGGANTTVTVNGVTVWKPLKGTGTAEDPILINDLADLILFRDTVDNVQSDRSNQFVGKYVKLNADIDLSGINWNPIGEKKDHGSFMGIFDGGNHTISNLYVEQAGDYLGLFAYVGSFSETEQAVIKNLTLNNVTVKSTNNSNYVGGVVGNATTTDFENVHVTGTVEISGRGYIGGIVGHGYSNFNNVSVKATNGTISSTFWCAGGVIGYLGEGSTITNAVVEGLTIKSAAGGLGSIVGMASSNDGTQPCTGENLSAKNVAIQTYTGAYGDSYAEYALGYLIGGDTSVMTGSNTVENVTFACSNGNTNPAVSDAVASANGAIYFDLQSAINAGGNITLLADVTEDITIADNATIVLDLNGKTLNGYIAPCNPTSLTVKNGSIVNTNGSYSAIEINAGELVLENVNVSSARHGVRIDGAVTATINGGEYKSISTSGTRHAVNVSGAANVTIKAGTFFGPKGTTMDSGSAVCVQAGAKVTIEGGNFSKGKNSTLGVSGTMIVTGGTFDQDPSAYVAEGYAALPDLNGNYVVGVKPTATVNNLGATTITDYTVYGGSLSGDLPLSFVMQFLADQDAEDMKTSPFADWYGDFVITFTGIENDSFTADGCYLAGYYGSFGWVVIPVDGMTIEEGVRYPVMLGVGMGQKYDYICSGVQDFKCALYLTPEILEANPNIQVKLELAVVDNSQGSDAAASALINNEKVYSVTDYTYDAEDFVVKQVYKVSNKAELDAALAAAKEGETILLTADIDYGTDQLKIENAIILDLGGKTLTTRNAYGGMSVKGNPTIKNGTIVHASNTSAIKVWNAAAFEDLVIDVQGKGDANKTIGGIVLQSGTTTHVGSIKNVTIKGDALTNGIETYNCGDAAQNVIGSMENVTIDAKGTGMLISAPVGTATNCSISGDVNGIEIWIKGTYSASLDLVNSTVEGGVFAHDEFSSNPNITNNGTLSLTGVSADDVTLTLARAENVEGVLKEIKDNAQAKVNDTYYLTLAEAMKAAQAGDTVTILAAGTYALTGISGKDITITGAVDGVVFDNIGAFNMGGANVTFNNVTFDYYPNVNYTGLQHSGDLVYNNCTINGQVFLYGTSETFNKCTFNQNSSDAYNVWTYGANEVEFNECTFNSAGKSVLIYSESASQFNDVTVTDCDFIASAPVDGKAAIEMDSSLTAGINLTIDGATTATGFGSGNVSGNSLWNNKKGSNTDANNDITVVVDGVTVLAPVKFAAKIGNTGYTTIADAIKAANAGETVTILAGNYTTDIAVNKAITVVGETDANGNNLVNITGGIDITADGATVKNLTASDPATSGYNSTLYINAKNVLVEGCVITDKNALRYSETDGTVTFKNSTITGSVYGIHFDGSAGGNIVIDNCVITGWTSFAGTIEKVTIKDTTFAEGNYNYIRFYQDADISGCTFNEKMAVDVANSVSADVTVTDCTVVNGNVEDLFEGADIVNSTITVDGVELTRAAKIGTTYYESLAEALTAAQDGDEVTILAAGTYALTGISGKDITITGAVDGVVFDNIGAFNMGSANVTFNNVTFDYYPNVNYTGLQHSGNLVYNNCTINGQVFLYGTSETFNKCTFNQNSADAYNVWTYGAKEVAFNECTFNSAGKSVLIYSESASQFNDVTVTDCDFIASAPVEGKAAIEMDSSLTAGINLTITNTTATGFGTGNVSGNSLWNNKKDNKTDANNDITVVVDDVTVLAPVTFVAQNGENKYESIQAAVDAAEDGATITVIADHEMVWDGALNVDDIPCLVIVKDKSITLDLNGKAITANMTGMNAKYNIGIAVTGTGALTINATNGGSIKASGIKAYSLFSAYDSTAKLTINGGTYELAEAMDCLIHSAGDETVTVNGGTFTLGNVGTGTNGQPWIFNANGANVRNVTVNGGTFNSDVNHQFWQGEVLVPETLALQANGDGTWTVVPAVAYVVERATCTNGYDKNIGYATLEEAIAAASEGKTVTILAGDYTTDIAVNKAITVVGETDAEGNNLVNITGRVSVSTGATVKNLNVHNEKTGDYDCALVVNGKDIVLDGVKLTGYNAMRYCYANGNITVKNSTINGSNFAVHFDGSAGGNIAFENCDITGWCSYASTFGAVSYTNCSIDQGNYSGHRYYNKDISFTNCDFAEGFKIDLKKSGTNVAITDTDMTVAEAKAMFKDPYYVANGNVTLNGEKLAYVASAYTANGTKYFDSLQQAVDEVVDGGYITVRSNVTLTETLKITKPVTLGLNGFNITGTDNATKNFALIEIQPGAALTIDGNGAITLTATNDRDWNAYSSVISNQRGKLTVNSGVTIEHLGGTDMAYAIDNLTNGKGTYAETIINGGTVKSTYRAIRQFLNGVEAQNILTINGGTIEGANKSIWMQDPNKNANTGTLTVSEDAVLKGDVYLYVTAGSTEWPVTVSIANAAFDGESTVVTGNVPEGYVVEMTDGIWGVRTANYVAEVNGTKYESLAEAITAATAGDTVTLLADITENVTVSKSLTIDGANFKYTGGISVSGTSTAIVIKNINFVDYTDAYAVTTNRIKSVTIENCTLNGYDGFLYANKSTPTVVVKNVTMNGGIYGMHWVYGTTATLENVTMTNVTNGLLIQNYASKTINLKNCSISSIAIWERDGSSGVQTFNFEGANTVGTLSSSDYAKYVLTATDATLTAPEGATVTTDVAEYEVKYENGIYKLVEKVVPVNVQSSSIVLGNELAMYFYVANADLEGTDYVAVVTKYYADGREPVTVEIPYADWEEASNNRMRFKFDGIAAKEMNDNIEVVIKLASSEEVTGEVYTDSIRGYIKRGFDAGKATGELATMLMDMLNYGAAAQRMFNYDVEHLANDGMDAYQKYATQDITCVNGQQKGNGYKSLSLTLESSILFNMKFYKTHVTQDMTAVFTFTDHYGKAHEVKVAGSEFVDEGNVWQITLKDLVVADASQLVTCTFLDADGNVVEGVYGVDSVESYCARAIAGNGGDYYEYIMKFCKAAYNYFH